MTNIELLAAQLSESILMDWAKEKQVELANKIAVELMHTIDKNAYPQEIREIPAEPYMPPIMVMYGTQVQEWRPICIDSKMTFAELKQE